MITRLRIENFKSHKKTDLALSNLTLLTGLNSSGKSSVIQTILLLRQSFMKNRLSKGLDLNEPLCDIGNVEDALYRYADEHEILTFAFESDSSRSDNFQFNAAGKYDDSFIPRIDSNQINLDFPFFNSNFQYLSAGRVAGIEFYPLDSYAVEHDRQLSSRYGQGDLVAHFLDFYGDNRDFDVSSDFLLHCSTQSKKLIEQVIAWEQEISPRVTIGTKKVADKMTLEFGYKTENSNVPLSKIKAKNVGFGIPYSLAIVVAILSASPGALLLIENPEAHLHPKGQSKMAELLCLAAKSGIQIIVETHSDHIFNGLRKSIVNKIVENEKVKIHYFKTDETNTTNATEVIISKEGRVCNHIEGLFDQFDNDLDALLGL